MDEPTLPRSKARILELGQVEYDRARSIQLQLVDKHIAGDAGDTFVFVEHPPTITIGRGARENNIIAPPATLAERGVKVCEVERGGDVTFHGPGQQVVYPILDLESRGRDLHRFLRELEEVVIRFLTHYGVRGERVEGKTGVWVEGRKICAIGIAVKHWVSYHGLALNLSNDLTYFELINPCGFPSSTVTSLETLLGSQIDRPTAFYRLAGALADVFQMDISL
jgi:lipoyl(octanoyl) transferase